MKAALSAFLFVALVGCTTPNQRVVEHERFNVPGLRDKVPNYSPYVTLHCRSDFYAPLWPDLQSHFLKPLASSEYCFVIDLIEIEATSEDAKNWTAVLHLDTGAQIAITTYGEFCSSDGPPYFEAALRRALAGLDAEQRRDPKLRQYIQKYGKRIASRPRGA